MWTSPPLEITTCLVSRKHRIARAAHLDLVRPAEVGHVDVEGDVVVEAEVELLTGETVPVLLDVGPRYDGHLLPRDGAG